MRGYNESRLERGPPGAKSAAIAPTPGIAFVLFVRPGPPLSHRAIPLRAHKRTRVNTRNGAQARRSHVELEKYLIDNECRFFKRGLRPPFMRSRDKQDF